MKSPSAKNPEPKTWIPEPYYTWSIKIVGGAIIVLTSPLWIPLWIVHLPFRLFRERKENKERLDRQALRDATPPPPPDLELERRRIQARNEQDLSKHRGRRYHDPIENDPEIAKLVSAARERAFDEVAEDGYNRMGTCHRIWARQQKILKEEHGIVWYPPSRMNPHMFYD